MNAFSNAMLVSYDLIKFSARAWSSSAVFSSDKLMRIAVLTCQNPCHRGLDDVARVNSSSRVQAEPVETTAKPD